MAAEPLHPLLRLSAAELAAAVRSGEARAGDVVEAALRRIDERRETNAFISVCHERALARAREIDRRRAAGEVVGPLGGVPLAVKDLFDVAGVPTTAGSRILERLPTRTAPAVARLEAAGAIVVGKTNMHEFAWGTTSQNPHFGTVANPALPGRVAGGSSGGTAAALADHQATIGLGTDTGGSIRIPAACCGIVGFKPAWGRAGGAPTAGVFPLAPSFDTVGPMARTVADVVLLESILTGRPNAGRETAADAPAPDLSGLHVGVLELTGLEPILRSLGARLDPAELPELDPDLMHVFTAECAATHVGWFPARRREYGPDLQLKLDAAQRLTAVQWARGVAALRALRRSAGGLGAAAGAGRDAHARVLPFDILVSPVLGVEPPADDSWEPDVRTGMTRWTRPFNFLGWPAIAIGGVQLAGRSREAVLRAALALEAAGVVPRPGRPAAESVERDGDFFEG